MAKILIVDDSGLARRSSRKVLESVGHECVEADDGLRALEQYYFERPSAVLLDVTMRGMDGIEVLTRLRELDPNANIVIVTADVQSSTREMAELAGACGFVVKPFSTDSLLKAVAEALQRGASCN